MSINLKEDKNLYQDACIGFYNDDNNSDKICDHYNNAICMFFIDAKTGLPLKCSYKIKKDS